MRRIDLGQPAVVDDRDAIRHGQRLALIVGHVHRGDAELFMQMLELDLHMLAQLLVECGQWLVHQQNARTEDECPRQRDTLTLPAGQLIDAALAELGQLYRRQRLGDALGAFRGADLAQLQRESDVFRYRHVRKQRVTLEHHADISLVRRRQDHFGVAEADTARVGPVEAGDGHQQRGLARPRRSQQGQKLAAFNFEVDRIQRVHLTVTLGQVANVNR